MGIKFLTALTSFFSPLWSHYDIDYFRACLGMPLTLQLVIMDNFVYYAPTKFVFGRYTEKRIGELAKEFGGTRALVVYGGGSAVSGAVGRAVRSLHAAGFDTFNLEGIQPNPADDRVREGIELVRMHDIDIIIAVGGGSVIDTAKAICPSVHCTTAISGISIVERLRLGVLCRSEWCLPYRLPAAKARAIR